MAKQSNAWKRHESSIAKKLGGKRHLRGKDFSESAPDVELPEGVNFTIECKYRKRIPVLLSEGLAQAKSYNKNAIPLLFVKERGKHGSIVCMQEKDFLEVLWKKNLNTGENATAKNASKPGTLKGTTKPIEKES